MCTFEKLSLPYKVWPAVHPLPVVLPVAGPDSDGPINWDRVSRIIVDEMELSEALVTCIQFSFSVGWTTIFLAIAW